MRPRVRVVWGIAVIAAAAWLFVLSRGPILLRDASTAGHNGAVRTLLALGVDPNAPFYDKGPLSAAAKRGHIQTVRLLLDGGADPDSRAAFGTTALVYAASAGHLDVVRLLVVRGANLNAVGNCDTAWKRATQDGHAKIAAFLQEQGAYVGEVACTRRLPIV
ncbi:MAG: ankyrin repeat domain-containing protein, partial [Deltaproteobacteria bacterium]|nr:ankyrin repeat domain-containing protein [Deltaproteobacteria bacterium]